MDDDDDDDDASSKALKKLNKRKGKQTINEESLMDHLKRIENGDISDVEMDSNSDESVGLIEKLDDVPISNEALMSEANRLAKENLLNSSESNGK